MREQIIREIKKGISIPKICKKLQIGKSTVYYHYKKLKGKKYPKTIIPTNQRILGEFIGIFAGDGNRYYWKKNGAYSIRIYLHSIDDLEYSKYIAKLIEDNFNRSVSKYDDKKFNKTTLKFYSKDVFYLLEDYLDLSQRKTKDLQIKRDINTLSKEFQKAFIRGIIDTDGHYKNDGRISISLIALKMIQQISNMLKALKIENKTYKIKKNPPENDLYELIIPRRFAPTYVSIIGFSNKRKNKSAPAEI
jgi:hypothetical protein